MAAPCKARPTSRLSANAAITDHRACRMTIQSCSSKPTQTTSRSGNRTVSLRRDPTTHSEQSGISRPHAPLRSTETNAGQPAVRQSSYVTCNLGCWFGSRVRPCREQPNMLPGGPSRNHYNSPSQPNVRTMAAATAQESRIFEDAPPVQPGRSSLSPGSATPIIRVRSVFRTEGFCAVGGGVTSGRRGQRPVRLTDERHVSRPNHKELETGGSVQFG